MLFRCIKIILMLFLFLTIKSVFCDDFCDFNCWDNGTCLMESSKCNGPADCGDGSDESFVTCKTLDDFAPASDKFSCASGALISAASFCNKKVDCVDKSDEPIRICQYSSSNYNDAIKGNCIGSNDMMCTHNQCIDQSKMCNGEYDCFNGRDESVELCMENCMYPHFQCVNGKCISADNVCDNKFDCIDGSDEFSWICNDTSEWNQNSPGLCKEPLSDGLKFSENTTFYVVNGNKVVYANQPVLFECSLSSCNLTGSPWNVCNTSGEWHFGTPVCRCQWINEDPNTNGVNGCKIDTYEAYKNHLRIYKCIGVHNCSERVRPPINDMLVEFACESDFTLYPETTEKSKFKCYNKLWTNNSKFKDPRCMKKCNKKWLHCRDSMVPDCMLNRETKDCKSDDLHPGTEVTFRCQNGFKDTEKEKLTLQCQEDGTWTNSSSMDKCELVCGKERNEVENSWTVALFMKNQNTPDFEYICAGVLIRHNLVLTAAHCVFHKKRRRIINRDWLRIGPPDSKHSTVREDFGWSVSKITLSRHYNPRNLQSDLAIIHFDIKKMPFGIICLSFTHFTQKTPTSYGNLNVWDKHAMQISGSLNLKRIAGNIRRSRNQDFHIVPLFNETICNGNSGSGFVQLENGVFYLLGIVSSKDHGGNAADGCTTDVTIVNTQHDSSIEFIKQTLELSSNTCD